MFAKIGRNTPASSGTNALRGDQFGGLIIAGGGNYKDITLGGKGYVGFAAGTSVALFTATAAIGLQVYNPASSGVNLIPHLWSVTVWATSATTTGMVLAVANALTAAPATPVAPTFTGRSLLGSTTGVTGACVCTTTCTLLAAPVTVWPLFHNTAAINTVGAEVISGDLQGSIAFGPGTVAVIGALGAAGTTVNIALSWEEVPIGL